MRYVLHFRPAEDYLESIFASNDLNEAVNQFKICYNKLKPFDQKYASEPSLYDAGKIKADDLFVRLVRMDIQNVVCLLYCDKNGRIISSVTSDDKDYEIVYSVKIELESIDS